MYPEIIFFFVVFVFVFSALVELHTIITERRYEEWTIWIDLKLLYNNVFIPIWTMLVSLYSIICWLWQGARWLAEKLDSNSDKDKQQRHLAYHHVGPLEEHQGQCRLAIHIATMMI